MNRNEKSPRRLLVFSGFSPGKSKTIPVPDQFFTDLAPKIDHLGELKITLFAIWYLSQQDGDAQYLTREIIESDSTFMNSLSETKELADDMLSESLERAVNRGTLIRIKPNSQQEKANAFVYLINSPRGRSLAAAFAKGEWSPGMATHSPEKLGTERPGIYQLYEENIGPLSPIIADMLRQAESTYPADWIADAIIIAVKKNVRNWRYVEAILESWQENGRHEANRRNNEEDYRRYIKGEYSDLIEH